MTYLTVCKKCGAVLTLKTKKKHKHWHRANKPIPGPPGPPGPMGMSAWTGPAVDKPMVTWKKP